MLLLSSVAVVSAETLQITGAQLKPYDAQVVTEQNGCFYNVNFTGLNIPNDVIVTQLDLFTHSDSMKPVNIRAVLFKHYANATGELVIDEDVMVESGFKVTTINPEVGAFDPINDFTTFGFFSTNEVSFCGASLTYVVDLIFSDSFD